MLPYHQYRANLHEIDMVINRKLLLQDHSLYRETIEIIPGLRVDHRLPQLHCYCFRSVAASACHKMFLNEDEILITNRSILKKTKKVKQESPGSICSNCIHDIIALIKGTKFKECYIFTKIFLNTKAKKDFDGPKLHCRR